MNRIGPPALRRFLPPQRNGAGYNFRQILPDVSEARLHSHPIRRQPVVQRQDRVFLVVGRDDDRLHVWGKKWSTIRGRVSFQAVAAGARSELVTGLPVAVLLDNVRSMYNV